MAKLMTSSKVFTPATIAALNTAAGDTAKAIAAACMDGAKVGITRDKFLVELRRVCALPCNTAAASAGLRAAAADDATLASVTAAIADQYEKDRIAARNRRKAAKKPATPATADGNDGDGEGEEAGYSAPIELEGLTLVQLETRRDALRKELAAIESQIKAMKAAAAAAASTGMGDAAVGGC